MYKIIHLDMITSMVIYLLTNLNHIIKFTIYNFAQYGIRSYFCKQQKMFIGPIIPLAKKLFLIKWDVLIQHGNKMNLWSFDPIMYCKNEKRVMYGLKVIRLRYNFALHNNVIYYQVVILYVFYCSGFGLNMP